LTSPSATVLEGEDISVEYLAGKRRVQALNKVDFRLETGKILGVVGESGSGKTTLGLAIIGLLPSNARIVSGEIKFQQQTILTKDFTRVELLRGMGISMIFQEPLTSLNPVYKVAYQLAEAIMLRQMKHKGQQTSDSGVEKFDWSSMKTPTTIEKLSSLFMRIRITPEIRSEIISRLTEVRIPDPEHVINKYPHELSGGMRQRVMIAMALAQRPDVLIADEPTTALDVTTQAKVLSLIKDLADQYGTAVMLVSHDLSVVAEVSDDVQVLYSGEAMEYSPASAIFNNPLHPYTVGLISSLPETYVEDPELEPIPGTLPDPSNPPTGCKFHTRCPRVFDKCKRVRPTPMTIGCARVLCHLYNEDTANGGN
jgi:oligopeptide/dipeptide ABC transporter ATP-binding protein